MSPGHGLRGRVVVDPTIGTVAEATARANYWLNQYAAKTKVLDLWCADYAELQPGQTLTLTINSLGISAATYSCIEKEHGTEGPYPGLFRFRLVAGNGVERWDVNPEDRARMTSHRAQSTLAYERT